MGFLLFFLIMDVRFKKKWIQPLFKLRKESQPSAPSLLSTTAPHSLVTCTRLTPKVASYYISLQALTSVGNSNEVR